LCHIGYVIDGRPYVTPTLYWREGERLYWHGSSASRMLRTQRAGIPVCVTVGHVDGLVLARSAFRHSMNYRAVMAFGTAAMVVVGALRVAAHARARAGNKGRQVCGVGHRGKAPDGIIRSDPRSSDWS
jgi:hypothetical protein